MNREIKFRAWDKNLKKFYTDSFMLRICHNKIFFTYDEKQWKISVAECDYMQFTGLHDKNGTPIYEGDILEATFNGNNVERFSVINSLDWDGRRSEENAPFMSAWGCTCGTYFYTFMNVFDPTRFAEVVGNIYEHPRLLHPNK